MRPEERINNFLKILGNEWKKQGVDLRFTQFLFNNGIVDMNRLHYIEEHELLQKYFPHIDPAEYVWWGTYGKDGKSKLKYILVKDMDTDHIEAILKTQKSISVFYKEIFENELKRRLGMKIQMDEIEEYVKDNYKYILHWKKSRPKEYTLWDRFKELEQIMNKYDSIFAFEARDGDHLFMYTYPLDGIEEEDVIKILELGFSFNSDHGQYICMYT